MLKFLFRIFNNRFYCSKIHNFCINVKINFTTSDFSCPQQVVSRRIIQLKTIYWSLVWPFRGLDSFEPRKWAAKRLRGWHVLEVGSKGVVEAGHPIIWKRIIVMRGPWKGSEKRVRKADWEKQTNQQYTTDVFMWEGQVGKAYHLFSSR